MNDKNFLRKMIETAYEAGNPSVNIDANHKLGIKCVVNDVQEEMRRRARIRHLIYWPIIICLLLIIYTQVK